MGGARDKVVTQLQALAMSGYEARAYVALIESGEPLNGYEVAKRSNVPRSTVYETLKKLVARGAAFEVNSDGGTGYVPLPPETLLSRIRSEFEEASAELSRAVGDITVPRKAHLVHHIEGQEAVLARTRDLIDSASEDLYLSLWRPELKLLSDRIVHAEERGVDVSLLSFDDKKSHVRHTTPHVFGSTRSLRERLGCRLLVVTADRRSTIIGAVTEDEMWCMYSDDPAVILVALEYVRHDIAIQGVAAEVGVSEMNRIFARAEPLKHLLDGDLRPKDFSMPVPAPRASHRPRINP